MALLGTGQSRDLINVVVHVELAEVGNYTMLTWKYLGTGRGDLT